ncbi:MAG: DUF4115 domain-containing protein [Ignavibacteria bacterium]|nr:MAG: DUF4115 domain-containing protein [Ignavibacteria bacterium]
MNTAKLKEFAEELKAIREEKKITLQQIKARTRIDMAYLEAIEEGNFNIMPQVYMRAFIKEYAESIGLDSKDTLAKYDLAKEGKLVATSEFVDKREEEPAEKPEFRDSTTESPVPMDKPQFYQQNWFIPAVVGASVIVVFLLVYLAFFKSDDEIVVREKPYQEIIEQKKQRFELNESNPDQQTPLKESQPEIKEPNLRLRILATDTSWVKVVIDSDSTSDFILYPERYKTFTGAEGFDLVLGNSGGVKLILNADTLNFKGIHKKVKHLYINEAGIKLLPMEKKSE